MHKLEKDFCHFGDEQLRLKEHLESLGKEKIVWESFRTVDSISPVFGGKSPALSIELLFNADKTLKEARIVDRVESITAKYDSSGKLVMDEWLLKHPECTEIAKVYEKKLGILLEHNYLIKKPPIPEPQKEVQEPSVVESPKQAFQPHAIKDLKQKPKVKQFEETVKIQYSLRAGYSVYILRRVEEEMGFKKGGQVKVSLEGEHIIMELMDEPRYISKVWGSSGSLQVTIHPNLLDRIGSEEGKEIKWNFPDASTVWETGREHRSLVMQISSEVAKEKDIKVGEQVEWVIRGRELTIEPVPSREEICLSKIAEVRSGRYLYARHLLVHIPREISDKLDKRKWEKSMEVGFEVVYGEHKKLVITPKQAFQPHAIKTETSTPVPREALITRTRNPTPHKSITEKLIEARKAAEEKNRRIVEIMANNEVREEDITYYVKDYPPSKVEKIINSCNNHKFDWKNHQNIFICNAESLELNLTLCDYNKVDPVDFRLVSKLGLPHEQFSKFLRDRMTAKGLEFKELPPQSQ